MTNVYFFWQLIDKDESDNKFVDCYLSCNADYLLTEDRHFDVFKIIDFPNVNVINISEFEKFFSSYEIKN